MAFEVLLCWIQMHLNITKAMLVALAILFSASYKQVVV